MRDYSYTLYGTNANGEREDWNIGTGFYRKGWFKTEAAARRALQRYSEWLIGECGYTELHGTIHTRTSTIEAIDWVK